MKTLLIVLILLPSLFLMTSCESSEPVDITLPGNISEERRKSDVQMAFDIWKERYLMQIDGTQYYVSYDDDHNTVSEAHSYGMLIMVMTEAHLELDTKAIFDGMFHYAKAHPSDRNQSLMAWKQIRQPNGTMEDYRIGEHTGSATDGDMDIAYALLFADELWGSEGDINYKQEAMQVIYALMEAAINKSEWTIKLGDWVSDEDPKYGESSRTSDWMLGHLATFYEVTGDERWQKVLTETIDLTESIQNRFSPDTGLLPDFIWKQEGEWVPVEADFLEGETDPYYSYNASRVPWRLAAGYFLTQNKQVKQHLEKMNTWIREDTNNDPSQIKAGYNLRGDPLASYSDMPFVAPFAISASINEENQEWVDLVWENMTKDLGPNEASNYFGDTIRLLVMLFMEEAGDPTVSLNN